MNDIQVIKKDGGKWHMTIHGVGCTFIPMALYIGNNLFPEQANADRGLRWRINRKWISYKQIKNEIEEQSRRSPPRRRHQEEPGRA
jgi:hypothetical protein